LLGVYFSGTGNTKNCVTEFVKHLDDNSAIISIEACGVTEMITEHNFIVFGYPVYFSNTPKIVKDFLIENKSCFRGKKVFIICTMGLCSGDGAGCSARLFKRFGADVVGGLHLKMPDSIGDEKVLKKSLEENRRIINQANEKIRLSARRLKEGNPTKEGLNILYHIAGLLGQRLWFYGKTATYKNKPNIDRQKCCGCGRCVPLCPMNNIEIIGGKAAAKGKCTMCYRCFSRCSSKALTILGKRVHEQCYFEKYYQTGAE